MSVDISLHNVTSSEGEESDLGLHNIPGFGNIIVVEIESGTIVMFEGDIADIPDGWVFCDGDNDTPDLRDLFVRGDYDNNGEGGSETHSHTTSEEGGHSHGLNSAGDHNHEADNESEAGEMYHEHDGEGMESAGSHTHSDSSTSGHSHDTSDEDTLPSEYYTLAYIMKE